MSEPQPPAWFQPPPPQHFAPRPALEMPERPHYRERRPVFWWTVLIGVVASVVWYVLIGAAAWSVTSLIVGMIVGMVLAGAATWILTWKGDTGLGIGLAIMIGFTASFMVFLGACYLLFWRD
jgi:hypothetical protein